MKQETLEEAAERYAKEEFFSDQEIEIKIGKSAFIQGAKWMQERMYSEEDSLSAFEAGMMFIGEDKGSFKEWFEKFKKSKGGEQ